MLRLCFFFVFVLILSLPACVTVGFEQPQPRGKKSLDAFPSSLLGMYDDIPNGQDAELIIRENSVFINDDEIGNEGDIYLSDSLVLKKFKGYYIANYRDTDCECWMIQPFTQDEDQLVLFDLSLDSDEAKKILPNFTRNIRKDGDSFIIDPNRRALKRMLKDPSLWEKSTLYRIPRSTSD